MERVAWNPLPALRIVTLLTNNEALVGLPLATKRGNQIPNERRIQKHPLRMTAAQQIMTGAHPNIRPRSLSSEYNCVGMVFAARRTWVDPDQVEFVLDEDGYQKVDQPHDLMKGDIVVYRDDEGQVCHVGVVASVVFGATSNRWTITVLSQWGADGEYLHEVADVHPNLGTPSEFWTDRK